MLQRALAVALASALLLGSGCVNLTPREGGTRATSASTYETGLQGIVTDLVGISTRLQQASATGDHSTMSQAYRTELLPLLGAQARLHQLQPPAEWARAHEAFVKWFNLTANDYAAGTLCFGDNPQGSCLLQRSYHDAAQEQLHRWRQSWPNTAATGLRDTNF